MGKAFNPGEIRYIKLGRGAKWAREALERGRIPFGYRWVPHQVVATGDWAAV